MDSGEIACRDCTFLHCVELTALSAELTVPTQEQRFLLVSRLKALTSRGVFLLTGVTAVVLLRTLHRDILKYNKLATVEDAAERRAGNSFTLTCSGNLIIPSCLLYESCEAQSRVLSRRCGERAV